MSSPRSESPASLDEVEVALARLRAQVEDAFERTSAVKLHIDAATGEIVDANPAAARFYGWSVEELRTMRITDINQLPRELVEREMARAYEESRSYFEFRHRLRSGEVRDVQVYTGPVRVGTRTLLESIICDITDRRRLEEELARAQRMDALSRLAGSVAHDFNNLLAAAQMSIGLVRRRVARGEPPDAVLDDLEQIVASGAGMTRQLLAFCRRQPLAPTWLDLRDVVSGLRTLLASSPGEPIELRIELAPEPVPVLADRVQLEQVVVNLVLNARDAMPDGGRVTVRVDEAPGGDASSAREARLRVEDTGSGIPPEVAPHIFEPFFTTRRERGGTGLGLATVFGIVTQSGGTVTFETSPQGSRFEVRLPTARQDAFSAPPPAMRSPQPPGGRGETVLVAEDDARLRELVVHTLEAHGYRTIVAEDGLAGLERAKEETGPIDLLLTDVMMPRKGGRELAEALVADRPGLRVLYVSGYAGQPGLEHVLRDAGESFLGKPFSPEDLLAKVREVLDREPRRGARVEGAPGERSR
ncbi:MAG: hypothetical protein OHK0013_14220 [Sandaracinaceae bacterium]